MPDSKSTITLATRIPLRETAIIRAEAARAGVPVSQFIRDLVVPVLRLYHPPGDEPEGTP